MPEGSALILGGGMTGLAAGIASGFPVLEATDEPGGICSSCHVRPGTAKRLPRVPDDGRACRFEIGGGHWIFGGDPAVLRFIRSLTEVRTYERASSVYFPDTRAYVTYPLQNHLRLAGDDALRQRLTGAGPAAALAFTWDAAVDRVEGLFASALAGLKNARPQAAGRSLAGLLG